MISLFFARPPDLVRQKPSVPDFRPSKEKDVFFGDGRWWRFLAGLLFAAWLAPAQATVEFTAADESLALSGYLESLDDGPGTLSLAGVLQRTKDFKPLAGFLNRGYTQSATWLRFRFARQADAPKTLYLWMEPPFLDEVDVYVQSGEDPWDAHSYRHYALGDHAPDAQRPLRHSRMVLPLQVDDTVPHEVYIRIRSTSTQGLRLWLRSPAAFSEQSQIDSLLQGGYLAIALTLAIINAILALRLRDMVYGYYSLYLFSLFVGYLDFEGVLNIALPSFAHRVSDYFAGFGTGMGFAFACMFVTRLFDTRANYPKAHRFLIGVVVLGVLTALSSGTPYYGMLAKPLAITGPVLIVLFLGQAWDRMRAGDAAGRLFVFAFFVSSVGAGATIFRQLGLLPINEFTQHSVQYSSVVHMVLMTLALSERVLVAEAAARSAARDAERKALTLAEGMTMELSESKRKVEESLTSERRMREEQERFIDTISHEYRTPLSIVKTNIDILRAKDLLDDRRFALMADAVRRLQAIFTDALRAHRLGRPPPPEFAVIDPAVLLHETLAEFRSVRPDCSIAFGPVARGLAVHADPSLLKTALRNVLENAAKYRSPADEEHPVFVSLGSESGMVRLTFANATDPEHAPDRALLFGRYVRGGDPGDGMGLGLYLVWRILQDHGGRAFIADTPADRFEIVLDLPLHEP